MAQDPRQQPARQRGPRQPRFAGIAPNFSEQLFVRAALWQTLRREARHPVARHLSRQLHQGRRLPILPFSLVSVIPLMILAAYTYHALGEAIGWALPLFLMLFSTSYCAVWIARIVALVARQARSGALDEVSVIPPGRVFVYLTICKVVLNEGDALYWLGLLRRVLAGGVFLMLVMSLCIAAAQLDQLSPWELAAVAIELMLLAIVIQLEHTQSALIACLLAIAAGNRLPAFFDRASAIVAGYILVQVCAIRWRLPPWSRWGCPA